MKMIIMDISYSNIRRLSNLTLSFVDKEEMPIKNNFVMMANGTGKTTTIELLKSVLDGSAEKWLPNKVREFCPLGTSDILLGSFSVTVKFDEKIYKYSLELNYETGSARIYTSTISEVGGGKENKRIFPIEVKELFTSDFVRRFVFDGEQAQKVLDNKSNEAEEAIKYLYGLDIFDLMLSDNTKILLEFQQKSEMGQGTDQQLKNNRTRRDELERTVRILNNRIIDLTSSIASDNAKIAKVEDDINNINRNFKDLNNEKNDLLKRKAICRGEIDLSISKIISNLRNPHLASQYFSDIMIELGKNMKKLKLPKTTSREFFKELSEASQCICGRSIGTKEKEAILENAESYLGEDQQSILNNIKTNLINSSYTTLISEEYEKLKESLKEEGMIDNQLFTVEKKLESAGGEKAAALIKEKDELNKAINKNTIDLEIIESKSDSDIRLTEKTNIKKAQSELARYEERIATITQTNLNLKRKQKFDEYILALKKLTNDSLKEDIVRKTNDKIKQAIPDDFIEVDHIEKSIHLKKKSGASAGQTLSVAFCYLGTLFEDSELKFPFIIDSPVNSIDKEKRRAIADIIPKIFNQMICLVMSTEVSNFADRFYDRDDSQFITVEAKSEIRNPIVHEGKEYFDKYQEEGVQ